jgi:hypothetical protein
MQSQHGSCSLWTAAGAWAAHLDTVYDGGPVTLHSSRVHADHLAQGVQRHVADVVVTVACERRE